ncbi:MAG: hypothetical protein ACRD1Y_11720, partial [Terriglobales bacterium]
CPSLNVAHSTGWYDDHARDLVARYEAVDPASLLGWLKGLLPDPPGRFWISGPGRDAMPPDSRPKAMT